MRSTTFDLWGGTATVATTADGPEHDVALTTVQAWVDEVDLAASHYRDDSELAGVNRADGGTVRIGPLLARALHVALDAARRTDGLVDPTVGAVTLSQATAAPRVTRTGSWRDVALSDDVDGARVTIPAGMRLDLGATAKAWAADEGADRAAAAAGTGVLVSLAGDIAMSGEAPDGGWVVLVTDDHRETVDTAGDAAQTVRVSGGGLATSSTTVRRRTAIEGGTVSHVVDPIRWRPVNAVWRTVTVAADDFVSANTATTAALVLGDGAPEWLEGLGLPSRLVSVDGAVLCIGAWPLPENEGANA